MKEIKDMSFEEIITRVLRVKTEDIKEQINKESEERDRKEESSKSKENIKEPKK